MIVSKKRKGNVVFLKRRGVDRRMILETICLSPYAEKVRWAMDMLGLDYQEEQVWDWTTAD